MFEQELYDREAAEPQSQQGDLFHNFEIKNWNLSSRIYKILAVSAVLNIAGLGFIGQSNMLFRKTCDSPFANVVCQVIDTVYVGTILAATEREYVDAAYEKTDLGDAEITMVDTTGVGFAYPVGYFKPEPEQGGMNADLMTNPTLGFPTNIPGFSSNPTLGGDLMNKPQVLPKSNPNAVSGIPDSPFSTDEDPTTKPRKGRGGKITDTDSNTVAQNDPTANTNTNANTNPVQTPTVNPTDPVQAVTINREPMRNFGKVVAEKLDNNLVDLSKNFKVTAEVALTEDGKLDTTIDKKTKRPKSRVLTTEGDAEMVKVVSDAISAIGDSGWLGYLRNQGIEKLNFTFVQDDDKLYAIITSDQPSVEKARKVSSGLNAAIQGALILDDTNIKKLGDDEKEMLKAASSVASGKQVTLNFTFPKAVAQDIIRRNIQKVKEAATGKANSQLQEPAPNNSTAAKR
jgi:hypothetical protein